MSVSRPNFIDSPYFYEDDSGFHLKEGAPEEVQKEFDQYMESERLAKEQGAYI